MKTLKRCLMLMLVVLMLLSLAAPAFAVEVEPAALVRRCTECKTDTVTTIERRSYIREYPTRCSHYLLGSDLYALYQVEILESCDNCSYSSQDSYKESVFLECHGINNEN